MATWSIRSLKMYKKNIINLTQFLQIFSNWICIVRSSVYCSTAYVTKASVPKHIPTHQTLNNKTIVVLLVIGYRVIIHDNKRRISRGVSVILINIAELSQLRWYPGANNTSFHCYICADLMVTPEETLIKQGFVE